MSIWTEVFGDTSNQALHVAPEKGYPINHQISSSSGAEPEQRVCCSRYSKLHRCWNVQLRMLQLAFFLPPEVFCVFLGEFGGLRKCLDVSGGVSLVQQCHRFITAEAQGYQQ